MDFSWFPIFINALEKDEFFLLRGFAGKTYLGDNHYEFTAIPDSQDGGLKLMESLEIFVFEDSLRFIRVFKDGSEMVRWSYNIPLADVEMGFTNSSLVKAVRGLLEAKSE